MESFTHNTFFLYIAKLCKEYTKSMVRGNIRLSLEMAEIYCSGAEWSVVQGLSGRSFRGRVVGRSEAER